MLAEYADFYDYSSSYPEGEPEDADSEVHTWNKLMEAMMALSSPLLRLLSVEQEHVVKSNQSKKAWYPILPF
jgi:hypothetical protein